MLSMLVVMGMLRSFVGVRTIIVGEYLAFAAVLMTVVYCSATPRPCQPPCAGGDGFDGVVLLVFATAGLLLLAIGLPVALLIATVRLHRQKRRPSTSRSTLRRTKLSAATIDAAWGLAVALPLSCVLAGPVLRLLM